MRSFRLKTRLRSLCLKTTTLTLWSMVSNVSPGRQAGRDRAHRRMSPETRPRPLHQVGLSSRTLWDEGPETWRDEALAKRKERDREVSWRRNEMKLQERKGQRGTRAEGNENGRNEREGRMKKTNEDEEASNNGKAERTNRAIRERGRGGGVGEALR